MKNSFLRLTLFLVGFSMYSQQDSQYTNYMYNTVTVNPAYAGSRDVLSIFGLHRSQWVGLDGAPVTNAFSMHTPISNSKIGIGLSIINDRIGPSNENSISGDVSYTIPTSEKYKLAFGIKATANLLNIDYSKLKIYDTDDNLAQNNVDNKFSPNIGAGIYYYSDKSYFGVSVPNFLETKHFDKGANNLASSTNAAEKMHYYFMGGYVFDVSENIKFKPAFLSKIVNGVPLQIDISGNVLFYNKLTLGVAYRWNAAMSALAGFQLSDSWFVGYGYDMEVTKLSDYNSGSHEIFLRYELFKKVNKVVSPRFF